MLDELEPLLPDLKPGHGQGVPVRVSIPAEFTQGGLHGVSQALDLPQVVGKVVRDPQAA